MLLTLCRSSIFSASTGQSNRQYPGKPIEGCTLLITLPDVRDLLPVHSKDVGSFELRFHATASHTHQNIS